MENATKALLIVAGVMIGIMILSLLVLGYNQISSYYASKDADEAITQLAKFNETFENYNKSNIRGTDLLTLMNKIIDYNERYSYSNEKQYPRIKVNIEINTSGFTEIWKNNFMYSTTDSPIITPNSRITNTTGGTNDKNRDKNLIAVTNIENDLIRDNSDLNLNSTKLQKLTSNISNFRLGTNETDISITQSQINDRLKRANLIKDILGKTINFPNNNAGRAGIADSAGQTLISRVQTITTQYYQFTQFKRAYFKCTKVGYDTDTARINEMNFAIKLKADGTVEFN